VSRQHRIYLTLFAPIPLRRFLTRPAKTFRLWRQRRHTAAQLAEISDRLLDDIGLSEISGEAGTNSGIACNRFDTMR
jgi:uncharacterized protein YjiS (DUF1127 family)